MRFVFGLIVGCLLTVGIAYVHDLNQPTGPALVATDTTGSATVPDGRMVNWDVVNRNLRGVNGWMQAQWTWITGQVNRAG
ncbi:MULTISPECIES: hypothetical protein [Lichenihabitans]|uniref:hypothetical protein n=1 Tax=Lichenihabitans TaxID=2723776 RepID=UPI0010365E24|nr:MULTISPECIES: hypothetical protein [Lichenihabitans]UDL94198.1 hypothetical protein LGH83_16950 [Lichenihabitans sp. PAMC28606]